MSEYKNNPKEYIEGLSDDEFYKMLESVGFEVREGTGKIIFTDTHQDFKKVIDGEKYRLNQNSNIKVSNNDKLRFSAKFELVA